MLLYKRKPWLLFSFQWSILVCFWDFKIMLQMVTVSQPLNWLDCYFSSSSCKDGYETYTKWKYDWSTNGQREASIKVYVSEMIMPFWVKCVSCSKWREFPEKTLTTSAITSWKCSSPTTVITSETKVIVNCLSSL